MLIGLVVPDRELLGELDLQILPGRFHSCGLDDIHRLIADTVIEIPNDDHAFRRFFRHDLRHKLVGMAITFASSRTRDMQ